MASVLHRTSKVYLASVNTPEYSTSEWIINPNLSAVDNINPLFWKIQGDQVSPMNAEERDSAQRLQRYAGMTLEQAIRLRQDDINEHREILLSGKASFLGHYFLIDQRARENINGTINAILLGVPLPPDFAWRDADNNFNVPMTLQMMVGFGVRVMGYVRGIYQASWDKKAQLDLCTTIDEVADYDIYADWPSDNLDGVAIIPADQLQNPPATPPASSS